MTSFATRFAGLASLALAALPLAGLAGQAHAAPVAIQVADLDLNSPEGLARFEQRARAAERTFCADGVQLHTIAACKTAVRAEIAEKLAEARKVQMARRATALASR